MNPTRALSLLVWMVFAATCSTPQTAEAHAAQVAAATQGDGEGFTVEINAPTDVKANAPAAVVVVLRAKDGFHLNKDFPTLLDVTPPAGVEVVKAKQTLADATKAEETFASFAVKFSAKTVGEKAFTAIFKFAVCTATTCNPKREALAWKVNVK